jgi:hypothetical protein
MLTLFYPCQIELAPVHRIHKKRAVLVDGPEVMEVSHESFSSMDSR